MSDPSPVPKLGIGLLYQEQLRPFIESERARFDFLEVIPDILWTDLGVHHSPRYIESLHEVNFLRRLSCEVPMVLHSIGLSIGSACRFDHEHISQIASWYEWLKFPWHSDHLAFILAGHGMNEINVGVTLPLPYDQESLELLVPRVAEVSSRIPVPFLLENNVYFFKYPQQDFDEAEFLNQLCETSGCRLLLDLHNLYTNSRNHDIDSYAMLDRLKLENVLEIHVAGGLEDNGFYQDAHSDTSPPEVWELLEWVLPRCPNLGGVVFELLGSWYIDVGEDAVATQLSRMRELWMRYQPAPQPEMVL
ncbi:MAG TPA: DUF692 family protein [Pyrinomonadaceae bacterium]|jgi:hypothetical protein